MRACVRSVMIWMRWVGVIRLFGIWGHASLSRARCWPGMFLTRVLDGQEGNDGVLFMGDWFRLLA